MSWWQRFKNKLTAGKKDTDHGSQDRIFLTLGELCIRMEREIFIDVPHEVTVVVPHAVIRKYKAVGEKSVLVSETVLESITIVHAPRHPEAKPQTVTVEIPAPPISRSEI